MYVFSLVSLKALTIDNSRLRESEKRLLKENVQLVRTCKVKEGMGGKGVKIRFEMGLRFWISRDWGVKILGLRDWGVKIGFERLKDLVILLVRSNRLKRYTRDEGGFGRQIYKAWFGLMTDTGGTERQGRREVGDWTNAEGLCWEVEAEEQATRGPTESAVRDICMLYVTTWVHALVWLYIQCTHCTTGASLGLCLRLVNFLKLVLWICFLYFWCRPQGLNMWNIYGVRCGIVYSLLFVFWCSIYQRPFHNDSFNFLLAAYQVSFVINYLATIYNFSLLTLPLLWWWTHGWSYKGIAFIVKTLCANGRTVWRSGP